MKLSVEQEKILEEKFETLFNSYSEKAPITELNWGPPVLTYLLKKWNTYLGVLQKCIPEKSTEETNTNVFSTFMDFISQEEELPQEIQTKLKDMAALCLMPSQFSEYDDLESNENTDEEIIDFYQDKFSGRMEFLDISSSEVNTIYTRYTEIVEETSQTYVQDRNEDENEDEDEDEESELTENLKKEILALRNNPENSDSTMMTGLIASLIESYREQLTLHDLQAMITELEKKGIAPEVIAFLRNSYSNHPQSQSYEPRTSTRQEEGNSEGSEESEAFDKNLETEIRRLIKHEIFSKNTKNIMILKTVNRFVKNNGPIEIPENLLQDVKPIFYFTGIQILENACKGIVPAKKTMPPEPVDNRHPVEPSREGKGKEKEGPDDDADNQGLAFAPPNNIRFFENTNNTATLIAATYGEEEEEEEEEEEKTSFDLGIQRLATAEWQFRGVDVLIDVDLTLITNDNLFNQALIDALQKLKKNMGGDVKFYLFTNMSLGDIPNKAADPRYPTRYKLVNYLKTQGIPIKHVITPIDVAYRSTRKNIACGLAYKIHYTPQMKRLMDPDIKGFAAENYHLDEEYRSVKKTWNEKSGEVSALKRKPNLPEALRGEKGLMYQLFLEERQHWTKVGADRSIIVIDDKKERVLDNIVQVHQLCKPQVPLLTVQAKTGPDDFKTKEVYIKEFDSLLALHELLKLIDVVRKSVGRFAYVFPTSASVGRRTSAAEFYQSLGRTLQRIKQTIYDAKLNEGELFTAFYAIVSSSAKTLTEAIVKCNEVFDKNNVADYPQHFERLKQVLKATLESFPDSDHKTKCGTKMQDLFKRCANNIEMSQVLPDAYVYFQEIAENNHKADYQDRWSDFNQLCNLIKNKDIKGLQKHFETMDKYFRRFARTNRYYDLLHRIMMVCSQEYGLETLSKQLAVLPGLDTINTQRPKQEAEGSASNHPFWNRNGRVEPCEIVTTLPTGGGQAKSETNPGGYDYLFKILLVGDSGVGKSSLLLRFADDTFSENYILTIGVDFKVRTLKVGGKLVRLQMWDTAGQDRFRAICSNHNRGAHATILCADITDKASYNHLSNWLTEIERYAPRDAQKLVVYTKSDYKQTNPDQVMVSESDMSELYKKNGVPYVSTSAKTGEGVDQAFFRLAHRLVAQRIAQKEGRLTQHLPDTDPSHDAEELSSSCLLS